MTDQAVGKRDLGIAIKRRSSIFSLMAILINPLKALPPEVFEKGAVIVTLFGRARLYISDPALIQLALVRNADALSKGTEVERILGPALGKGLLTADGAAWRWQRQSMAPAFQPDRLRGFLPLMIAAAEQTRDRWLASPGAMLDIGHEMMGTTFQIIVDTMLSGPRGIDAAKVEQNLTAYLKPANWTLVLALLRAPLWVPYPGKVAAEHAAIYLRDVIMTMVRSRRRARVQADLLALLLAARDPETDRAMADGDITDNLVTFISAGHETTALALTWAFILLSKHPAIEAKMVDEIEHVTNGQPVAAEHVEKLVYIRQVINETLRLYPPAPMILRTAEKAFDLPGLSVAAGTMITVPIYAVHRHGELWDRPHEFDPDRFASNASTGRHRYAFMPFGAGPRVCIGNAFATSEAVAILAILIRAVRLTRVDDAAFAARLRVTLRPDRTVRMRAVRRDPVKV